jgi:hypothetical protein
MRLVLESAHECALRRFREATELSGQIPRRGSAKVRALAGIGLGAIRAAALFRCVSGFPGLLRAGQ